MKKVLIASGVALLAFATIAGAQGYTFNTNLTVGSTGSDVVALQTWLMNNGYSIPAIASGAASKGYFGSQTKAAVAAYQKAVGLPAYGFFGPMTRNVVNAGGTASAGSQTMTVNCPAGYICTAVGGGNTTPGQVAGPTGITTPGVPGILSVSQGPLSSSVMNVGAQMAPVLTVRVQAQYSDLAVQSLTLDLGNSTNAFNKIFNKLYVTDGSTVLASQALDNNTVVQSGTDYIVGLAGFNIIVPKGTYKDIVIKADLNSSIDSTYLSGGSKYGSAIFTGTGYTGAPSTGWGVAIPANGLRAVDGAGVNLNGPSVGFAQALSINASLVDNAIANVSLNAGTPQTAGIPVSDTTNGQYNQLPVLIFDVNAQNDTLHLHEVKIGVGVPSGTGSVSAAYLYQGSTLITSASVSGGIADFNNINNGTAGATIPVNTTVPYTVKVDVTGVTSGSLAITATTSTLTIYNSINGTATVSGSATGYTQTIANAGPLFTLSRSPTLDAPVDITPGGSATNTTFRYTAHFNVNVQSVGTSTNFGLPSDTTSAAFGTTSTGSNLAQILENGVASTTASLSASYVQPTNTTLHGTNFTLAQNQSVNIPVTYTFTIQNPGSNSYAVQMQGIRYSIGTAVATTTSTFMAGQTAWQTNPR